MSSADSYPDTGRTAQKRRTRDALIAAARELVASGVTPTLDQAASRASISRTTAYRYFPNQRALLAAAHPETATRSLLPPDPPGDPEERLSIVISAFIQLVVETEPQQRTMLRLSLQPDRTDQRSLPLRQGRGVPWIAEALEPLHTTLSDDERHQLALAIRSTIGIEALVWLTDVAGLDRSAATQLRQWAAKALLHGAVDWAPPPTNQKAPGS